MSKSGFIVDQLKRVYEGEAWHGPALREILSGVTAGEAAARPLASAHSIWEIALHIKGWMEVARLRVIGEGAENPPDGDWPAVEDASAEAWAKALAELDGAHRRLIEAVSSLSDSRFREKAAGQEASVYFTLHGLIQHNLYHAGQIALLKKA
jgi:uncharacterized damage-inducible protein DinB